MKKSKFVKSVFENIFSSNAKKQEEKKLILRAEGIRALEARLREADEINEHNRERILDVCRDIYAHALKIKLDSENVEKFANLCFNYFDMQNLEKAHEQLKLLVDDVREKLKKQPK